MLWVDLKECELQFSSPAQLEHCIQVLAAKPLPTTRQLSAKRGASVGPNGHWLSRLPARLKSPRRRERVVETLRSVYAQSVGTDGATFNLPSGRALSA